MKKPKSLRQIATAFEAVHLNCKLHAPLRLISESTFKRLWKLAKEAIHTNKAHEVED